MRHEDIPDINNPKIRFPVLEGDKLINEVLNGSGPSNLVHYGSVLMETQSTSCLMVKAQTRRRECTGS